MGETINTQKTGKFIDWWVHVAFGAFLLSFLTLIASPFFQRTLLYKTVTATDDEIVKLEPVQVSANSIGAMSVNAEAQIGADEWVTFEIQLLDQNGKIVTEGVKEGWRETGSWYEDGESGSYDESDTLGGMDVKSKKDEKLTVAIALLEYGTNEGTDIDKPVPFQVTVKSGVMDVGYFWFGTIGSLFLWLMTMVAAKKSGKKVINEKINDSDPTGRATLGGENKLVRVKVEIEADETTPSQLEVCLFVNDAYGEQIFAESLLVNVSVQKENGKFQKATANLNRYFVFPQAASYGFHVEVHPDEPIDRTKLIVKDGVKTLFPVDVLEIGATA
ncbi:hypothetical protein [Brunnivagina elsteri]|uniref:Uncharacterized protein n=1 Tax=Brunnivagina elsteri CCALA 953 TaxID=987040 RepID=A0A2A2TBH8_9CYAN|nr:hypothetical protein [Calothrix elsteri]PAX51147.1 hypothetical protein CK510_26425 [Calothrix elsteri CCALA 953]